MRKVNGVFVLSSTDKKNIEARCRAIARKAPYTGSVEAWLNTRTGSVSYMELIGNDSIEAGPEFEFIVSFPCREC